MSESRFGPTQKDIAEALGLSQSTVALGLSPKHQHKLLPETVARIQAKAEEVGYRPQRFAQTMSNQRSHTIGLVFLSSLYQGPSNHVRMLARALLGSGYHLLAVDLDWFGRDEQQAKDYLAGAGVEGAVLCNVDLDVEAEWTAFFEARSIPVIAFCSSLAGSFEEVHAELRSGVRALTRHHLDLGSRKLTLLLPQRDAGFVGQPGPVLMERAEGFIDAIRAANGTIVADAGTSELLGIPPHAESSASSEELVGEILFPIREEGVDLSFEFGRRATVKLIHSVHPPESLLCSNDDIAMGALSACLDHGIRVPHDLRISGFDDAPFAAYCSVPLTTVRQPSLKMADWTAKRIIELIENRTTRQKRLIKSFPCQVVIRGSTCSPDESYRLAREGRFRTAKCGTTFERQTRTESIAGASLLTAFP